MTSTLTIEPRTARPVAQASQILLAQLSAVVQLIDGFTMQPALALQARFLLDGKPCLPLAKASAFYVFENLADGAYQLDVLAAQTYFAQSVRLQVPMQGVTDTANGAAQTSLAAGIVVCTLEPSPLYPFPEGSSLIRGQIVAQKGQTPLSGVKVAAQYQTASGKLRNLATQSADFGRYDGRFALALRGRLAPQTAVRLTFSRTGFLPVQQDIQLQAASMQCLNIEMRSS